MIYELEWVEILGMFLARMFLFVILNEVKDLMKLLSMSAFIHNSFACACPPSVGLASDDYQYSFASVFV
jgi:hypothetical protein